MQLTEQTNPKRTGKIRAVLAASLCAMLLSACASSSETDTGLAVVATPTSLTPKRDPGAPSNALVGSVNENELRRAIERYRVAKQRGDSYYDQVGADLNGDGRAEAIVLFAGPDWCLKTGCSLVIFQEETTGYKPVSHVTRVRPPVLIGPDSNFGWRDLVVNTGGGAAPIRTVRLGFTGKGYPINGLLQPEPVQELLARSQQVLAESRGFTAAMTQLSAQASAE